MKNLIPNCFKAGIAVIIVLSATGFDRKPVMNISTVAALEKYSRILKDHTFFLIPELRENPLKWFDSIPEKSTRIAERNTITEAAINIDGINFVDLQCLNVPPIIRSIDLTAISYIHSTYQLHFTVVFSRHLAAVSFVHIFFIV